MIEFKQKRFIIIFFCFFQLKMINCLFNVYETDGGSIVNPHDHHCLFAFAGPLIESMTILNAYCFRPTNYENMLIDQQQSCFGQKMSFKQMKSMNIPLFDLFTWNAPIKMIDSYSKYLLLSQEHLDNTSYCKCLSPLQFGEQCQYKFEMILEDGLEITFETFLDAALTIQNSCFIDEKQSKSPACYIGITCQTSLMCLDWRQICNGIVDCDHGEDEILQLCSQMELQECDPEREFRCQNGMCIPISAWLDNEFNCMDQSDEILYIMFDSMNFYDGFLSSRVINDETTCNGKQYSCGDGQCISYSSAVTGFRNENERCKYRKNVIELKRLFSSKLNSTDRCWTLMICLTGFSDLYSSVICSNQNLEFDIKVNCPDQFFFPSQPVFYSFVYFLYEKTNRIQWFTYTGPDYICYQESFCLTHKLKSSTVSKGNLTCFPMNATVFSWKNFYEYVQHLFSSCYSTFSNTMVINSMNKHKLFRCKLSNTVISHHRLKNKVKDCYFGEDEDSTIDFCSINLKDKFDCTNNQTECIRQIFVKNNVKDCADGSDEYSIDYGPKYSKSTETDQYIFNLLCDNIVDYPNTLNESGENDETDCQYWPYKCDRSPYTVCNGLWNCANGVDELNCVHPILNTYVEKTFKCNREEHYCIQFIDNRTDIRTRCLNVNRTNDGIIDCIGATDERFNGVCVQMYPMDYRRRFHCMNSSICITAEQVCNRIIDCPFEDDELVCPWLYHSNASEFHCKNEPSKPISRCEPGTWNIRECLLKEQSWFCDLSPRSKRRTLFSFIKMDLYPVIHQTKRLKSSDIMDLSQMKSTPKILSSSIVNTTSSFCSSCNHGYPIKSALSATQFFCLCPIPFYGDYCQYQSERIMVHLTTKRLYYFHPSKVFRLIFYLLDENQKIISYRGIVHSHQNEREQYSLYLIYRRLINASLMEQSRSKFIRIDSYIVREAHVQYISSWFYDVLFPFLPVNRLSVGIDVEDESILRLMRCKKNCGNHGKCMYYLNARHKEYCRCDHGWIGERCHRKLTSTDLCHTGSCGPHSNCVVLNQEKKQIQCICPLGISGDQCYITYHVCLSNKCENNGTCLPLDPPTSKYVCICPDTHNGPKCENSRRVMSISIGSNVSLSNRIPAATVIVAKNPDKTLNQERKLFMNFDLPTVLKVYEPQQLALIQIYHNYSHNYYYKIATVEGRPKFINTSVIDMNRCIHIRDIFNKTILNGYSYLKRIKLYHLPCGQNRKLRCFFDEKRMCFCDADRTSNCYSFDHSIGRCDFCQYNGICLNEHDIENEWKYTCICPPCTFGSLCQFSTNNYYMTLDILVGKDIRPGINSFSKQPTVILIVLIILSLILACTLVSNLICFFILSEKKLRQVGCDIYLLATVFISEIGIIALFLRYLYMIIIQMYVIEDWIFMKVGCVVLEYLIRLVLPLFDWLTACISVERAYIITKDVHFTKQLAARAQKQAYRIVGFMIIFNIVTTLHRPFYLTLVGEPLLRGGLVRHPWCILRFESNSWNIYERFINIFHLTVPFVLHLISIVSFIVHRTRTEMTTSVRKPVADLKVVIQQQLSKYKSILISTSIITIVKTPRLVLTFVYGCAQESWQQNAFLAGYLVSYLPLTALFFIYVLPSPKYKNQLKKIIHFKCFTRKKIVN